MKIKLAVLGVILSLVGVAYLIYDIQSPSEAPSQSNLREDVVLFESTFFDFLSERFDELQSSDLPEIDEEQLDALVEEAIGLIDDFVKEFEPNQDEMNRIHRLKFYTYLNVSGDYVKAQEMLENMSASEMKYLLLKNYIEAFAKFIDEDEMRLYLEKQVWADTYEPTFTSNISEKIFFSNPIGKPFPDYIKDYFDFLGIKHQLSDYRGKYVLIDFWATWCTPCLAELPYLIDAYNQYGPQGKKVKNKFDIISFSFDQDLAVLKKFLKKREIKWVQYHDGLSYSGPLVTKYKVKKLPTTYLLDPDGKVVEKDLVGHRLFALLKAGIVN